MICCSTKSQSDDKQYDNIGLVPGHAYALLSAAEVLSSEGQLTKIVQVRNPWGNFEWKGDWSDDSPCWTDFAKS